jgi:DGQHR domain-containing protein
MKSVASKLKISGLIGACGDRDVFLGFAPASILYNLSCADILNDDTGEGYQRPYNKKHSENFKQYINLEGSSTIPLTFNLRKGLSGFWKIKQNDNGSATLLLDKNNKSLAQVDCQHRLGELKDSDVPLAFMSFIGLDLREEMAMFTVINSKAKGLSSSLTDYHESNLLDDIASDAPHLYIARKLNEDFRSPWYRLIRYGGETTSGLKRRTSFRMMQKSVQQFLKDINGHYTGGLDDKYGLVVEYWNAIQKTFSAEWKEHRHHLITKGVGLYSLMMLLSDMIKANPQANIDEDYFLSLLEPLKQKIDWKSNGTFANAGGQKGAKEAYLTLKGLLNI